MIEAEEAGVAGAAAAVSAATGVARDELAGRSCPLHYRYRASVFAAPAAPEFDQLELLYIVGGLYGNLAALQRVLELFDAERGRKRLIFNGDFHWFDADPAVFFQVQQQVLAFDALRGNVETELSADEGGGDAGCGCAYPDWVGDAVVQRSNRILQRLKREACNTPALRAPLAALPMWRRADVGGLRLAIVHGDAESLAGWGFAQEHQRDAAGHARLKRWFAQAEVDVFACTHTCLPLFHRLQQARPGRAGIVLNNGAAGMPNFSGDAAGLLTRVALRPFGGPQRRFGLVQDGVHLDAIAIEVDAALVQREFLRQWPAGSDAHASYWRRIQQGPDYTPAQALLESD